MSEPLSSAAIQEMAAAWYKKLDVHAPVEEIVPMLAKEGVTMVFPEATVEGIDGFKGWYDRVINIFFDEVHTLKEVSVTPKEDGKAEVKVVVKWEASVWKPPAPFSERIILDAYQTWEVQPDPETGNPVVLTYIVDELKYYEGSAKL
jgi:hypothetical protein